MRGNAKQKRSLTHRTGGRNFKQGERVKKKVKVFGMNYNLSTHDEDLKSKKRTVGYSHQRQTVPQVEISFPLDF